MKNHLLNNCVLEFNKVSFSYNNEKILLEDVNFHVFEGGEIICLLGASGSGKSTIINLILKHLKPQQGFIRVKEPLLPVFQDFNQMVLPWFKALRNLTYGMSKYDIKDIENISSIFEIKPLLNSFPFNMSGGEKQRLVFARALLRSPKLLIVDEPLSSIDAGLSKRILPKIRQYLKQNSISSLWVTHDIIEAIKLSDRILILSKDNGIIELKKENFISEKALGLKIQEVLL